MKLSVLYSDVWRFEEYLNFFENKKNWNSKLQIISRRLFRQFPIELRVYTAKNHQQPKWWKTINKGKKKELWRHGGDMRLWLRCDRYIILTRHNVSRAFTCQKNRSTRKEIERFRYKILRYTKITRLQQTYRYFDRWVWHFNGSSFFVTVSQRRRSVWL